MHTGKTDRVYQNLLKTDQTEIDTFVSGLYFKNFIIGDNKFFSYLEDISIFSTTTMAIWYPKSKPIKETLDR